MKPKPLRYAITDRSLISGTAQGRWQEALDRQARRLAAEGVEMLQLRERDLSATELAMLAHRLRNTLRGSSTRLLINSRADIAIAAKADGVHLRSSHEELSPDQVYLLYEHAGLPAPIITVSCHTIEDVTAHRSPRVYAILFGPVFEKVVTHSVRAEGTGPDLLRQACEAAAPTPVIAIGGIAEANIPDCMDAGAVGIAGIRLFQRA